MSIYSTRSAAAGQGVQPWSKTITLFPGGGDVSAFFGLYQSQGDVTLTGANTIPTLPDGPEKVVRYGNLTLGDGTIATSLTASNRCKGLTILCDTLVVKSNATLGMSARGPCITRTDDPFFPFIDFKIPFQVTLSSSSVSVSCAIDTIRRSGIAPWDSGVFQSVLLSLLGFNLSVSQVGSVALLVASGCGGGGVGAVGGTGTNGGCGGGGGGYNVNWGGNYNIQAGGGSGTPYGGGSGTGGTYAESAGAYSVTNQAYGRDIYSGPGTWSVPTGVGAGAGNPCPGNSASNGVGGKLVVIAKTAVTIHSGGKIESRGVAGSAYGGSSGGGHVSIITPSYANSGTVQCPGGTGSSGYNGGAGSVVTKTFADMGW
ncbi:MAG: hypothetical protein HY795_05820 [Desulfovibrio sp.]|nr:hypothetical protein [Desulfovibrio sp.]MBI4961350.1 hypothetical protein [Desulfovibrio sp.]